MRNSYKYFREGDKIISIKRRNHFRIFRSVLGSRPKLLKVYIFRRYLTWVDIKTNKDKIDYSLMMVKNDETLYDGREFISVPEYRGIQLKKIKRKMFFKRLFKNEEKRPI